ncbi:hypothetical protein [Legionella fairfieldensis]|uniref:hypothetical protein n=1 Tax=Legionella fairfieldensis TaxID=45064 RepID=UPI000A0644EC|nr:hypothetical protein [Legionella fairfieldensis]
MMRIIIAVFTCFFYVSGYAVCPNALPTNDVNFCASFKDTAGCHCRELLPKGGALCNNPHLIYETMLIRYKSLQNACATQTYTSAQDCMDNWSCYLNGGVDSHGRICSSTRLACR